MLSFWFCRFSLILCFYNSWSKRFFIRNTTRSLHTVTYFENLCSDFLLHLLPASWLIYIYIVMSLRFPQSKRNQRRYRWRWIESHLIICGFERLCRFIPASPSSDVCQCRALTQSEERLRGVFRRTSQSLKSTQRRIRGVVVMCSGAPHSLM